MNGGQDLVEAVLRKAGVPDALTGDLLEEYAAGRRLAWFWREATAAVVRTAVRDLRRHKFLALRAVSTGTATILVASGAKARLTQTPWAGELWMYWILTLLSFLFAGWVVGRTHRQHCGAMVLAFLAYAVVAKAWVYTTHFAHYWKTDGLERFFIDVGLTVVGFGMIVIGGLLPNWQRD